MNRKGFTLIELVIVITVIGVLSLLLGSSLQGSIGSSRIEGEVKEMYADLMHARARAVQRNHIYFVQVNTASYQITEDTDDDGAVSGGDTNLFAAAKPLSDQVTWSGGMIQVDTRGMLSTGGALPAAIQFSQSWTGSGPDYDCILLSQSMVNIGQMNGGACVVK